MGVARMSGRPSVFTSQDYISDHIWKAFTNLLPPTSLRKIKYNVRTRSQARGFQAGGWNRQVGSTSPIHGHRRRKCWSCYASKPCQSYTYLARSGNIHDQGRTCFPRQIFRCQIQYFRRSCLHGLLKYFESPNIQCVGVVVADYAEKYSHWTAVESLSEWCAREGVPAISGVDTRAIVTHLREVGSSLARITIGEEYDADQDEAFVDPEQINLVKKVSTKAPFHVSSHNGDMHVAVIDCGVKENILRSLVGRGASATVFPCDYPIHKVAHHFDGVFISNGPGDPTHCQETVYHLARLMETSQVPVMGICLGHQLLALAAGARTIKLKYGNRAHNIPALDLTTGQCHITSQNHGYAVDTPTLPAEFKEYFVNLNDGSNEGMIHKTRPIFSTQFHPEAKGGPMDSSYLFDMYIENVQRYKNNQAVYPASAGKDNRPSPLLVDILAKERVGVAPAQPAENIAQASLARQAAAA